MKYNPDKHHRRSIRLKGYDYSQAGFYFVTICTWQRECLFGEIKNVQMHLNRLGEVIRYNWFLHMGDSFPKASVSTDEQGGIRLTWSKVEPNCQVRLVCPAAANQPPYLYHELGNDYAVEREVTVSRLSQQLE